MSFTGNGAWRRMGVMGRARLSDVHWTAGGQVRRLGFYAACREPDLAVCVATGDDRLYANMLLTVGYITPPS